jgi:iron complex outermembrane recepter protein
MKASLTAVVCIALTLGLPAGRGHAQEEGRPRLTFNIQAQPMEQALTEFGATSGLQVLFDSKLAAQITAPEVIGSLSAEDALKKLLERSPLSYEFINARTVAIRMKGAAPGKAGAAGLLGDQDHATQMARARISADTRASASAPSAQAEKGQADSTEQAKSGNIEEIVVTAQKRVERLQDVPVPVTAISAEKLTTTNQLRVEDYYSKIPGLTLAPTGNGNQPTLAIRGVTTGGDTSPTVGIVVDEISYGASVVTGPSVISTADIDPGDLERVEVLRGPQGTLYGAASIGGLLKFVTADPSTERLSGRLQVGSTSVRHGDDLGHNVRGHVNVPITDTFAIRASGFTLQDPGYIDNVNTGQRDVNRRDAEGARISSLWQPSENFSAKINAMFQNAERLGTSDVDISLGEDSFRQALLRGTGNYGRDTELYSAVMVGKVGAVEITSATGYSIDEQLDTLDTTPILAGLAQLLFGQNFASTVALQKVEKFSQEIRAELALSDRVTWLAGAVYTDEDVRRYVDNQAADANGGHHGSLINNIFGPAEFQEYAAFSNITFALTDRFDVQVGGRYSHNEQVMPVMFSGPITVFLFGEDPHLVPPIKTKDSSFTYLVTPRFKVTSDVMAYARLASGYRPGGPNYGCGYPQLPCEFGPDMTRNYDIGIKGTVMDGALSFDASIYYIDWKDVEIAGLLTPDHFFDYTDNASAAHSQGIEVAVQVRPSESLVLSGWIAYNEAQLDGGFPDDSLNFAQAGDDLPYSSPQTAHLSADWTVPAWGTVDAVLGVSATYVGGRTGRFQGENVERAEYSGYTTLELRAGLHQGNWTLDAFVNNLTDERGTMRGGTDANFATLVTFIQPLTTGINFGYRW